MREKRTLTHIPLCGLVVLLVSGCGPYYRPYDSISGAYAPVIEAFPEDGEVVARNAAVWIKVIPNSYRVTDFSLYEVYGGRLLSIYTDAYWDSSTNNFLFCPRKTLSAWTDYYVTANIAGEKYGWYFRTDDSFDGDPHDCYYVTARGAIGKASGADASGSGLEPYTL